MGTKTHKFTGYVYWTKFKEPDDYLGVKRYKVTLALDEAGLEEYKKSGCRVNIKETEHGPTVNLSKPYDAPSWHDASKWGEWGPPQVMYKGEPFDELIGNESKAEVFVQVYDTRMGKGHRIESMNILELVPYNKPSDNEEGNSDAIPETTEKGKEPW